MENAAPCPFVVAAELEGALEDGLSFLLVAAGGVQYAVELDDAGVLRFQGDDPLHAGDSPLRLAEAEAGPAELYGQIPGHLRLVA